MSEECTQESAETYYYCFGTGNLSFNSEEEFQQFISNAIVMDQAWKSLK